MYVNKGAIVLEDWFFIPPGMYVTEKSKAPKQLEFISVGAEGHKVLLWVKELMGAAFHGVDIHPSNDGEFRFAAEDRGDSNIAAWAAPMDEVLEGVLWLRCQDLGCKRCVNNADSSAVRTVGSHSVTTRPHR